MALWEKRGFRWMLAAGLLVLDAGLSALAGQLYHGAYANWACSAMTITGNQNPFVRAGYVLEAARDSETRRVFVNPENGEYHVLND